MKKLEQKDINAILRIKNIFDSFDNILKNVKGHFNKNFSDAKLISNRGSRLISDSREYYRDYSKNFHFIFLNYGFCWFVKDEVFVYLDFVIKHEDQQEDLIKIIQKIPDIEIIRKNGKLVFLGLKKPLISFLDEDNQIEAITGYLKNCIDKVSKFKDDNSELFKA